MTTLLGDIGRITEGGSRSILVSAAISIAVLSLFFLRGLGLYAAAMSAALIVIMELLLIRWVTRDTSWSRSLNGRSWDDPGGSRMLRKMNILSNSLKGKAYSQQMVLTELKTMLIDRTRSTKMINMAQLSEMAKEQKGLLFGSDLLYRLYSESIMDSRGKRLLAMTSEEFVRLFNDIVTDLSKNN